MSNKGEDTALNLRKGGDDDIVNESQVQEFKRIGLPEIGLEQADYDKALIERDRQSNLHYKGKQVSSFVKIEHFKIYGVGITLFFNFVWDISILFLIFSMLSILPMCYNYLNGNSFQNTVNSLELEITKLSIGAYSYGKMTGDNAAQTSLTQKWINAMTDLGCCVIFFIFYFYWEKKSEKIHKQIREQIQMPSENTVQVTKFPECADQTVIESFMSKFGSIKEVASVKNYQNKIYLSKQIYQDQISIRELRMCLDKQYDSKKEKKIEQIEQKINKLNSKLAKLEKNGATEYIKFFVVFEKENDRNEALKKFKPYQKVFSCCTDIPEDLMINSEKVYIEECFTEPAGIIWENVHVNWSTRWIRTLFQFILILIIVGGGFLFISFLNVVVSNDNSEGIDTSTITAQSILTVSSDVIKRVWCVNNISTYYSDENISPICQIYWYRYIMGILITIGISLAIIVFKLIVKLIVIGLAKFQRYTNHTEQSVTMMTNLMVTYLSTTVLITFLMQANVFGISFKSAILKLVTDSSIILNLQNLREYKDLTHQWYLDIGYQIWFNSLILAFIPHFTLPIVSCLLQNLNQCLAKGEILQKNMESKLKKPQFQIQDHYANILMLVVIGLLFGGSMPAILPITFIGLITRYVFFKIAFIRFSRVPKTYNQALNNRALNILKITLVGKCIFAVWIFGTSDIFAKQNNFFSSMYDSSQTVIIGQILLLVERIFLSWYFSILALVFTAGFVLRETLVACLVGVCHKQQNEEQGQTKKSEDKKVSIKISPINTLEIIQGTENQDKLNCSDSQIAISQRALTKSYKIENNPDYSQILYIMQLNQHRENDKSF